MGKNAKLAEKANKKAKKAAKLAEAELAEEKSNDKRNTMLQGRLAMNKRDTIISGRQGMPGTVQNSLEFEPNLNQGLLSLWEHPDERKKRLDINRRAVAAGY